MSPIHWWIKINLRRPEQLIIEIRKYNSDDGGGIDGDTKLR